MCKLSVLLFILAETAETGLLKLVVGHEPKAKSSKRLVKQSNTLANDLIYQSINLGKLKNCTPKMLAKLV